MEVSNIEEYLEKLQIVKTAVEINSTVSEQYLWTAPSLGWLVCTVLYNTTINKYAQVQEVTTLPNGSQIVSNVLLIAGAGNGGTMANMDRVLVQKNHQYNLYRNADHVHFYFYELGIPEN